jgi:hypothetical protein
MWADDIWDAAANVGSGTSYNTPMTTDTVPSNALQSMTPVDDSGGAFGSFWGGLGGVMGAVANTELARYVQRRTGTATVSNPAGFVGPVAPAAGSSSTAKTMLIVGGVGVAAVVLVLLVRK